MLMLPAYPAISIPTSTRSSLEATPPGGSLHTRLTSLLLLLTANHLMVFPNALGTPFSRWHECTSLTSKLDRNSGTMSSVMQHPCSIKSPIISIASSPHLLSLSMIKRPNQRHDSNYSPSGIFIMTPTMMNHVPALRHILLVVLLSGMTTNLTLFYSAIPPRKLLQPPAFFPS